MSVAEDLKGAIAEALNSRDNGQNYVTDESCRQRSGEVFAEVKAMRGEILSEVKVMRNELLGEIVAVRHDTGKIKTDLVQHVSEQAGYEKARDRERSAAGLSVSKSGVWIRAAALALGLATAIAVAALAIGRVA